MSIIKIRSIRRRLINYFGFNGIYRTKTNVTRHLCSSFITIRVAVPTSHRIYVLLFPESDRFIYYIFFSLFTFLFLALVSLSHVREGSDNDDRVAFWKQPFPYNNMTLIFIVRIQSRERPCNDKLPSVLRYYYYYYYMWAEGVYGENNTIPPSHRRKLANNFIFRNNVVFQRPNPREPTFVIIAYRYNCALFSFFLLRIFITNE